MRLDGNLGKQTRDLVSGLEICDQGPFVLQSQARFARRAFASRQQDECARSQHVDVIAGGWLVTTWASTVQVGIDRNLDPRVRISWLGRAPRIIGQARNYAERAPLPIRDLDESACNRSHYSFPGTGEQVISLARDPFSNLSSPTQMRIGMGPHDADDRPSTD